jgi:D-beta-D-heptose 7-phosphate kinase/D-beta-D-heptose 1-phosphate adenosyltransferase
MCSALGASVGLIGVTGKDTEGELLDKLLTAADVTSLLVIDPDRPTTVKERICGVASGRHRQQLARLDRESTKPIPESLADCLVAMVNGKNDDPINWDAIIVSDYAKGVCTDAVVQACRDSGVPVYVDPLRPSGGNRDWKKYAGATCIVPNRQEAGCWYARGLWDQLQLDAAIIKQDSDGCILSTRNEDRYHTIRAKLRQVHDVTGAGDQFIATLAVCRSAGLDWLDAATVANSAAGLQVERHGCEPVQWDQIQHDLQHSEPCTCLSVP